VDVDVPVRGGGSAVPMRRCGVAVMGWGLDCDGMGALMGMGR
jgi:hypothetical protein